MSTWAYPVGDELDRLIATSIFGEPQPTETHDPHMCAIFSGSCWMCMPEYDLGDECIWEPNKFSTDRVYALQVVDKMLALLETQHPKLEVMVDMRLARFREAELTVCSFRQGTTRRISEHGSSLPHAICLAALSAKEHFLK